jgi:hypothetical protein
LSNHHHHHNHHHQQQQQQQQQQQYRYPLTLSLPPMVRTANDDDKQWYLMHTVGIVATMVGSHPTEDIWK